MMPMTKYHGLGNDFVILHERDIQGYDLSVLAQELCDRHTGIGADGLIVVQEHPLTMIYYNSDGSRAKMCGNGIRCFAAYCYDYNLINQTKFDVETLAGVYTLEIVNTSPFMVQVHMGKADFNPRHIPMNSKQQSFINEPFDFNQKTYHLTSLFMGTTHTVVQVDNLEKTEVISIGKAVQNLDIYPDSTNVNFYEILDENTIRMQTYERGAGLTLACGTGASAVYSVLHYLHGVSHPVEVQLPLGSLYVSQKDDDIIMVGPAENILLGTYKGVMK